MNTKTMMYFVLLIIMTSTAHAGSIIDLNEPIKQDPFKQLTDDINRFDIVSSIAKNYDMISIEIEYYKVVLEFEDGKLKEIREFDNEIVDTNIKISRDDVVDLLTNWETMDRFDKIKFLIKLDMPIEDVITFGSIAMGVMS